MGRHSDRPLLSPALGCDHIRPLAHRGVDRGDRLILYTDGITEARNAGDDEFGEDRLIALAVENRLLSATGIQARLAAAVASFTGGTFQDDATLIVLASHP